MHKPRLISLPLAAALSAVALAGPAAASPPGPPTWPTNPQPITSYHSTAPATNPGLDLDSAGIGAAASAAILAAGAAGLAGVRRRRKTHPRTVSTP